MQEDLRTDAIEREGAETHDSIVTPRLVHLADANDLQVAEGDLDIRGWDVRTADGEKVGTVNDLIVDTTLMKVRYLDARIDREVLNSGDDRHVLIPLASARLDDDKDAVYLHPAIVDPRSLPPYDRASLASEHEALTRSEAPSHSSDEAQFFGQRRRGRESANYLTPLDDTRRTTNELP